MGHVPVRSCVACRRRAPQLRLVRFAVERDSVVVDAHRRQPGRGAYLCSSPECADAAFTRHGVRLIRALRRDPTEVTVDIAGLQEDWNATRPAPQRAAAPAGVTE